MSAAPAPLVLAGDFPSHTRSEWRELVAAVLMKSGIEGDPEAALTSRTYDGIDIKPLYTAQDVHGIAPAPADRWAAWDVRQRHADSDAARVNAAMLQDLSNGATSIWLVVGAGALAVADLPRALDGIYLDLAPIALDAGTEAAAATAALLNLARERGVNLGELHGSLGADPIGVRARTGTPADLTELGELARSAEPTALRVATVDATVYHEAGGSDADEIGISLAVGVAYLRALVDAGLSVDDALARIEFRYAVTADQFGSIAKLRASRRCWTRVAELSGAAPQARTQYQHATTSAAMLSQRDPWVNMLRTTVACFAAAVGGAEAITVLPFDNAIGLSDDFARRIARNTHSVLHDESSVARVVDPAGGSWYVETLSDELATIAWERFVSIERAGGASEALNSGYLDRMLASARDARAADIAHRRLPLTGVSEYAHLSEVAVTRSAQPSSRTDGALLPSVRYAAPFEELRDRADKAPTRPRVYLATLGPVAAHSAREGFAANLFAAGGIETVSGNPADFADAGTTVACICSSDKVYGDHASAAARELRAAGATHIYLAGQGDYAGVDDNLFVGVDVVAVLSTTLDELGVAP